MDFHKVAPESTMTPTPQETMISGKTKPLRRSPPGEEVVISGMSGSFPGSDSVSQFMENLYNKVDMVTPENRRWVFDHPEVPKQLGMINGMSKFDAQFFRVHYKQAMVMEPMNRKLMEHAYGAIYDSGINPVQLTGKKIGVFIGSCFSESEKTVIYENVQRNGFGITGCNRAMYANRISYWIDGKGPSFTLDLACASATGCLEHAYRSISSGQCEAAIVGGCNLCMHPNISLNIRRAGFLCLDGKTRCFDKNSDGYVRADAIGVIFLQKAKDAKRIYSQVYHAKTNFSSASEPIFPAIRDPKELQEFLETFYSEIGISPDEVEYVEANGTALPQADTNELKAIAEVFAKKKSIKIGCVKSNMGSSEAASGLCGITKICLAYHNGKLPGNLHYNDPLDVPEVQGKVQVLTDNVEFGRGFAALNSFSYSGANVHVLLKGFYKQKDETRYLCSIPRLVLASGRQENCVTKILENLRMNPIDPEQIALIHNIHKYDIPGHMSRGYTLLDTNDNNETVSLSQSVEFCPGITRPVWFVYSGMGSQWATMGASLMKIPIFATAIQKCHKVLEPKGVDIVKILTDPDKTIYDNILHSFVGIAAVQIGLTDTLKEMGIVPDYIIGHSVGELGCAYADGCFTAEEMILSAYSRGLVSVQTPFIRGSMAAVGLGYKTVLPMCPPEIEVACHNSTESSTISGPEDIMKQFVAELTSRGIFAKEVPCSNIAYHSRYIAEAGPALLKYLNEVIKTPKARSEKWISTSVPQDKWDDTSAKYSSAEYHTNNLLNSVLFEETSKLIPSDALVIEIAPHGLLQAILKRSLPDCAHVPLTRRGTSDPVKFLLEAFGKLYEAGLNLNVDVLYPTIEFPVSTGTPFLSQNVEWEHSEDWPEAKYFTQNRITAPVRNFMMSIHDDDYKYFKSHVRDGNCVFPESAFLVLVWETLAMHNGFTNYKDLSVVFENVQFHGEVIITLERAVDLQIMIFRGHNKFEVTYEDSTIVSGVVSLFNAKAVRRDRNLQQEEMNLDKVILSSKDIYTIMSLRGYDYKNEFKSIHSSTFNRNKASIIWNDNWVTFLDSLLQLNAFAREFNGVSVPYHIKKLKIDTENHKNAQLEFIDKMSCMNANLYNLYNNTSCGGVEIDGLVFKDKPTVEQKPDILLTQVFKPHFSTAIVSMKTALQVNLQIIHENLNVNKRDGVLMIDLLTNGSEVLKTITNVAAELNFQNLTIHSIKGNDDVLSIGNGDVVIVDNLLADDKKMNEIYKILPKNTFIMALELNNAVINPRYKLLNVITAMTTEKLNLLLLKKVEEAVDDNITYIPVVHDQKFSWILRLQMELQRSTKIVLVSERQHYCGSLGLVKKLNKIHGNKISLVIVDDFLAPSFDYKKDIFSEQLKKDLTLNVYKKGQWGGYYFVSSEPTKQIENVRLTNMAPDFDALSWTQKPSLPDSNNIIQVRYAGVSIRDVNIALGRSNSTEKAFGMDFSGINVRGENVMGVVPGGAIGTSVVADSDLLWPVPEHWTLEDAATVPLAYAYAYYCLTIKTKLRKGTKVLINDGAGALSQAVISICLSVNCKVYVTGCDNKQKEFLLAMFPGLPAENISRTPVPVDDKDDIRTTNRSYDIIINSLSGSMRTAAMKCIGYTGIFLDTCEYDMLENEDFGMDFLALISDYHGIQLNTIFMSEYAKEKRVLQQRIADGIAKGIVRPLSRVVYTPHDVTRAFRLLSADQKCRGKVLIDMKSLDSIDVTPRMTYSKGCYVVVNADTALSIELADHLIQRGARNLVIHMKSNCIDGYHRTKFLSWNNLDVSLKICTENLQTEEGCVNMLKMAAELGSVRGIFIVHDFSACVNSSGLDDLGTRFKSTVGVVANLDLKSRHLCDKLDHFVVINYSSSKVADEYISSVTDKICRSRNEITLPALVFRAGQVKEVDEADGSSSQLQPLSVTFSALETSLKQKQTNVITYNRTENQTATDFLQKVARIIGVKNLLELNENLTLKDLLLSHVGLDEIDGAIRNTYQTSYPTEKLSRMTVANLKSLERELKKNSRLEHGLDAIFTYIDQDECSAAEPVVTMSTAYSSVKEEEQLDPKSTYLMLIPGFEGHGRIFTTLSERLKVQALTFQLTPDMPSESIPQIAAHIAKFLRKRVELKSKFYLLGYSFGVNVAFELARIFEAEGHVGVVYCLDSSPDALRAQLDAYIGKLNGAELQDAIINHMYKLMSGIHSTELKQELETKDNWNDKVELCVHKLRGLVKYSHQYKRCLLNSAYQRILLAREYEPDFKLESELVLIKGIPDRNMAELPDDFNLSKYTKKPVKVFDIESDHVSAYEDCRVASIVNRLLEPKLIEEFKNKNLCWTYYADVTKTW